jgi:hypothetical protein
LTTTKNGTSKVIEFDPHLKLWHLPDGATTPSRASARELINTLHGLPPGEQLEGVVWITRQDAVGGNGRRGR